MNDLTLYADYGCPFAHRVLALLEHLKLEFELHESTIGEKPPGLSAFSPSEQIPLLVHDGLVLTESRVILEHLAERFEWSGAYPDDAEARARVRLATTLVDEFLTPHLTGASFASPRDVTRFGEALDLFEEVLERPGPTIFTLQVAPVWLRLEWWQPASEALELVRARPRLSRRLDDCLTLPCIVTTSPDRELVRAQLEDAMARGLIH